MEGPIDWRSPLATETGAVNLRNHKARIKPGLAPFIGIPRSGSPMTEAGLRRNALTGMSFMGTSFLGISRLGIGFLGTVHLGTGHLGISLLGFGLSGASLSGIGILSAGLMDQPRAHRRRPPPRGRAARSGRCALAGGGRSGRSGAGPWGARQAAPSRSPSGTMLAPTPLTQPQSPGRRSACGFPSTTGDHHA